MVKMLSAEERKAIEDAVLLAEKGSDAELAVVVARASDEYRAIALSCGLVLGCLIALLLWMFGILTRFPLLMLLELASVVLFLVVPGLRHLCLKLLPRRVLFHHAVQRAATEYVHLTHHLPPLRPVVLLYVSLAERYVHIYSSREVRAKIPDGEWHVVVKTLTGSIQTEGVHKAVIKAVEHAAEKLKHLFPATGKRHDVANLREL